MANEKFYPVEVLVEQVQSGEYGWLDYVNHYSRRMKKEYEAWCVQNCKAVNDDSAEEFLALKSEELEEAMEKGDL